MPFFGMRRSPASGQTTAVTATTGIFGSRKCPANTMIMSVTGMTSDMKVSG